MINGNTPGKFNRERVIPFIMLTDTVEKSQTCCQAWSPLLGYSLHLVSVGVGQRSATTSDSQTVLLWPLYYRGKCRRENSGKQALGKERFVPKHLLCNRVIYKFWDFLFAEWQAFSLQVTDWNNFITAHCKLLSFPSLDLQPLHRNFPAFLGFKLYPSAPSSWAVL